MSHVGNISPSREDLHASEDIISSPINAFPFAVYSSSRLMLELCNATSNSGSISDAQENADDIELSRKIITGNHGRG